LFGTTHAHISLLNGGKYIKEALSKKINSNESGNPFLSMYVGVFGISQQKKILDEMRRPRQTTIKSLSLLSEYMQFHLSGTYQDLDDCEQHYMNKFKLGETQSIH